MSTFYNNKTDCILCPITCNGCYYDDKFRNFGDYLKLDFLNIYNAKCLSCKNLADETIFDHDIRKPDLYL
jgi:hypothetical protein